jgi:hypothetical protein
MPKPEPEIEPWTWPFLAIIWTTLAAGLVMTMVVVMLH